MSYCHLQPGGIANIDMSFHPLCISYMRSRVDAASCLGSSSGGGGGIVQSVSVSSFSPASGGAGLQVTITGSNFTNVTAVRFGGTNAFSYTVNNSTQITAVLGAGATGQVQVVTVTGIANSSQTFTYTNDVSASSSVLSFPPIRIAKEAVQTLTLRNNSTSPVVFVSTALTGANAGDFAVVSTSTVLGSSLGAGQTQTLTIRYRPSAEGTRTATLNIAYTGKPIVSVSLVGTVDTSPFMELSTTQVTTLPVELGETSAPVLYELRGSYLGSSVLVVAPADWQLALSSTATSSEWASRLEIPAQGTTVNASIWVRFLSRREGLQTGTITHWAGSTSAPLAVSSFTNTSYLSVPQTLDLGALVLGQSTIGQYYFQATNIGSAVQIQSPSGMKLAFDDNGPWMNSLTLNPVARKISSAIFVRFEPSTNGVVTGLITHTVGIRSAVVVVQAKVSRPLAAIQSSLVSNGVLNFGYVAPRYTSTATYWLEITNASTSVTVQSPDGFTVALADDNSWSERLVIPVSVSNSNVFRRLVFVRFAPRFSGTFTGAITHTFNGTIATVRVFGSSIVPKLGIETRVLDFGRLQANTSATLSYRIQAEGITTPITVQMPRGLLATLSEHDSWRESLVITPVQGQATVNILVRTKPEIATGQPYMGVIDNFATENDFFVQSTIAAVANVIPRPVTQTNTTSTATLGNNAGNPTGTHSMNGSPSSNNQTTSIQNNLSSSLNTASSYPNPFSDVVSLSWNQNQIGRVSIRIFATNGVLTRTMYVGNSEIGTHRTQWDGRDSSGELVSSGTYFAQILVNGVNIAQNIRLVVIR
jgi:hypothetical protein